VNFSATKYTQNTIGLYKFVKRLLESHGVGISSSLYSTAFNKVACCNYFYLDQLQVLAGNYLTAPLKN